MDSNTISWAKAGLGGWVLELLAVDFGPDCGSMGSWRVWLVWRFGDFSMAAWAGAGACLLAFFVWVVEACGWDGLVAEYGQLVHKMRNLVIKNTGTNYEYFHKKDLLIL